MKLLAIDPEDLGPPFVYLPIGGGGALFRFRVWLPGLFPADSLLPPFPFKSPVEMKKEEKLLTRVGAILLFRTVSGPLLLTILRFLMERYSLFFYPPTTF